MVLDEGGMVAHADERGESRDQFLVDRGFIFAIERTGRLVQHCVTRILQEHSRESEALTLASREDFLEIEVGVKAATILDKTAQIHKRERLTKLCVRDGSGQVRVIQLHSKASDRHV